MEQSILEALVFRLVFHQNVGYKLRSHVVMGLLINDSAHNFPWVKAGGTHLMAFVGLSIKIRSTGIFQL